MKIITKLYIFIPQAEIEPTTVVSTDKHYSTAPQRPESDLVIYIILHSRPFLMNEYYIQ